MTLRRTFALAMLLTALAMTSFVTSASAIQQRMVSHREESLALSRASLPGATSRLGNNPNNQGRIFRAAPRMNGMGAPAMHGVGGMRGRR